MQNSLKRSSFLTEPIPNPAANQPLKPDTKIGQLLTGAPKIVASNKVAMITEN